MGGVRYPVFLPPGLAGSTLGLGAFSFSQLHQGHSVCGQSPRIDQMHILVNGCLRIVLLLYRLQDPLAGSLLVTPKFYAGTSTEYSMPSPLRYLVEETEINAQVTVPKSS